MTRMNLCIFLFISVLYTTTSIPIDSDHIQELNYNNSQNNLSSENHGQKKENEIPIVETILVPFDEESEDLKDEIMKTANAMVFRAYFKRSMPRRRFYRPVRRIEYYPIYADPYSRRLKSEDKFPLIA